MEYRNTNRRNKNRGSQQLRVWEDAIELYRLTREYVEGWRFEDKKTASQAISSADSVQLSSPLCSQPRQGRRRVGPGFTPGIAQRPCPKLRRCAGDQRSSLPTSAPPGLPISHQTDHGVNPVATCHRPSRGYIYQSAH